MLWFAFKTKKIVLCYQPVSATDAVTGGCDLLSKPKKSFFAINWFRIYRITRRVVICFQNQKNRSLLSTFDKSAVLSTKLWFAFKTKKIVLCYQPIRHNKRKCIVVICFQNQKNRSLLSTSLRLPSLRIPLWFAFKTKKIVLCYQR